MMICIHTRLLLSIMISVLLYYLDVLTDIAVLTHYWRAHEIGFFGITSFAIFASLLAQVLYSPLLSIYRDRVQQQISTPSCIFRLLLSAMYCTPLYLLYKFLHLQCCRFAKGSRDELQLAKISDADSSSYNQRMIDHDEQQKQDPNMIDGAYLDAGVLTERVQFRLLTNMVDDVVRFSFVKSCFQSSINVFVQIFVLGEYFLFRDETRSSTADTISLSGNDVLSFPRDTQQVYLLMLSTAFSFVCLCTASWSQISDLIVSSPQSELNYCIPFLFRLRAVFESSLRVLRFMSLTVVFGAIYGVYLVLTEVAWKTLILCCCDSQTRRKRKAKKQRKRSRSRSRSRSKNEAGVHGSSEAAGNAGNGYAQLSDWQRDRDRDIRCECCEMELYKSVASWLLFSRERVEKNPCLMRFTDTVLWTAIIFAGTVLVNEYAHVGKLDGLCEEFLQFQNDCMPLEIVIAITALIVALIMIYTLSPSIFNLVSTLDQDSMLFASHHHHHANSKKQKLLNVDDVVDGDNDDERGIKLSMHTHTEDDYVDEYDSDEEDTQITVIDISQPVQNPTMPKKPKRKYSNNHNLMLMSVDEQIDDDVHDLK